MKYVVFSKPGCPYCQRAEELLESKSLPHHVVNFREGQTDILAEIKEAASWKTVPMIFKIGTKNKIEFIGGCSDLEVHLGV